MKKIFLIGKNSNKQFALVDDEDFVWLSKYRWWADGRGYCYTNAKGKNIHMHRLILSLNDSKIQGAHLDQNKLNNQRANLKRCSSSQNRMNKGKMGNNKSGYKGVVFDPRPEAKKNPWIASIKTSDKPKKYIGSYRTKEEAALAYNKAAIKYHKEFAYLNIIK